MGCRGIYGETDGVAEGYTGTYIVSYRDVRRNMRGYIGMSWEICAIIRGYGWGCQLYKDICVNV